MTPALSRASRRNPPRRQPVTACASQSPRRLTRNYDGPKTSWGTPSAAATSPRSWTAPWRCWSSNSNATSSPRRSRSRCRPRPRPPRRPRSPGHAAASPVASRTRAPGRAGMDATRSAPEPNQVEQACVSPPSRLRSRYIPAAVRRAIWKRDDGRCAFVGPQGRCGQTRRLEFHHRLPYAEGGQPTASNIELRCVATQPAGGEALVRRGFRPVKTEARAPPGEER